MIVVLTHVSLCSSRRSLRMILISWLIILLVMLVGVRRMLVVVLLRLNSRLPLLDWREGQVCAARWQILCLVEDVYMVRSLMG